MRRSLYCPLCEREVVWQVPREYPLRELVCRRCRPLPLGVRMAETVRLFRVGREARDQAIREGMQDNLYDVLLKMKEEG